MYFAGEILKRVDWGEVAIIGGITVTAGVISVCFPPAAPCVMIASGALMEGGTEVYRQLQNGDNINWYSVIIRSGAGAIKGGLCLPGVGTITTMAGIAGTATLEDYLCSVVKGDHSIEALQSAMIQGGFEGLTAGSLKWLGNKMMAKQTIPKAEPKALKPNIQLFAEEGEAGGTQIKKSSRMPGSAIDEKFAKIQYKKRIDQTPLGVGEQARGFWTGERGESTFIPNKPEIKELLKKYNLEGIPYKNGEVDFSFAAEHQVTVEGMAGGKGGIGKQARSINFSLADKELSKILGKTPREVKIYRENMNLTWHECNDMKTMQLVPSDINGFFGHTGGVGEINLLFDLLEGKLK